MSATAAHAGCFQTSTGMRTKSASKTNTIPSRLIPRRATNTPHSNAAVRGDDLEHGRGALTSRRSRSGIVGCRSPSAEHEVSDCPRTGVVPGVVTICGETNRTNADLRHRRYQLRGNHAFPPASAVAKRQPKVIAVRV